MSWGELMVIGTVALIVIGPKDLPKALRTLGQVTTKVRRMAAEFQGQFNEAMREAELDEVKRQIQGVNDSVGSLNTQAFNPMQTIRDELKGAIEKPAEKVPSSGATEAAPHGLLEAALPEPVEAPAALSVPAVPPVADPATSYAASLQSGTPSEPLAGFSGEQRPEGKP